ncbi:MULTISPECIES: hypothetical protein [unclassified Mesorhizobium]|uniref:hypothetical protein n=1 Tax=unclassified Mesorhizobium TaxID=325217 RepID=UPI000A61B011|nr:MULTISPECIES: hypothetical protein [unclassified Mesorhizobium]
MLITGATGGLGSGAAKAFATEGSRPCAGAGRRHQRDLVQKKWVAAFLFGIK